MKDLIAVGLMVLIVFTNVVTWWLARRFGIIDGFLNHSVDRNVRAVLTGSGIDVDDELDKVAMRRLGTARLPQERPRRFK